MNPQPMLDSLSYQPTRSEIELRAHQLWCQRGCPHGHDVDNWIEAERQLREEAAMTSPLGTTVSTGASVPPAGGAMPASEDVAGLAAARSDSPHAALAPHAPLATAVEDSLIDPGRPNSRRSKTSVEL